MDFSSKLLEKAVEEFSQLPGIGKKTSLRLMLHLLKQPVEITDSIAEAIKKMRHEIIYCKNCHNISDFSICEICSNPSRNQNLICVVEDIRDVMAIENTSSYKGIYHVLGGKISPIDGIGPSQLNINSLIEKTKNQPIEEIIFALSATIEGDTTNYYIYKQIEAHQVKISTIARGISIGGELEYTDEITLSRSIMNRIPFDNSLKNQ